ncbi:MAG: oligosaccharide flippase family protein [Sideroxydans sp.]|nr:oligosaccharide flippase family protein [Sideroxydans sp.]
MGKPQQMTKTVSQERSRNYLRQVKGSAVFKGLAVGCSFLAVPLMIHYLGQEQFGVWSTMLSVMTWITFFDLGLGNGLRNKLAESLAKNQPDEARSYISSAYSLIGLISLTVFVILALVAFIVPWQTIFNTQSISANKLSYAVLITGFFIALNFWVSLINPVLNAVQKTSFIVMGQFLFNALSLFFVYVIAKTTDASLLYLATAYGVSMVGANALLSGWFYKGNHSLIPKLSLDFSHVRPLLNLGLQFFAIQIAVLIIFTTSKILIAQLFGPEFVTPYDVVFKFFGVITMMFGLLTVPLCSSYTDAYHRGDFVWIRKVIGKQLWLFGIIVLVVLMFIIIAKPVIKIWIGDQLVVPMPIIISMGLFVIISSWNSIFAYFLNGIGKIRFQMFSAILAMIINIPIAFILTKYIGTGVEGVVLATCASLLLFAVIGPFETYFVLRNK